MRTNKILFFFYPLIITPLLAADLGSTDELIEIHVASDKKINQQSFGKNKNLIQKTGLGELTLEGSEQYAAIDLQEGALIFNAPVVYDPSSEIKLESNTQLVIKKDFLIKSPLVRLKSKGQIIVDGIYFNNQYEDSSVFFTGMKDSPEIFVTQKGIGFETNSNIDWNLSLKGEGSLIKKGEGLLTMTAPIVHLAAIEVKGGSIRFFQNMPVISKLFIEKNTSFISEISKLSEWSYPIIGSGQFIKKGQGTLIFNKTDASKYEGEIIIQQGKALLDEGSFRNIQIAPRAQLDVSKVKRLETLDLRTRSVAFLKNIEDSSSDILKISKLKIQNGASIAIQYDPIPKKRIHPYLQIDEVEFNTQGAADKLLIEFRPTTKDTPHLRTIYPLIYFKGNDEFGTLDFVQRLKVNPIANYQSIYGEESDVSPTSSYVPYTHLYADREKGLIYLRLEDKQSTRATLHHPNITDQADNKKEEKIQPVTDTPLPIDSRFLNEAPIIEFPAELREALEQMARCDIAHHSMMDDRLSKKGENYFYALDGSRAFQIFQQLSMPFNDSSFVDIFKSIILFELDHVSHRLEFNRITHQLNYLNDSFNFNLSINYDSYQGLGACTVRKINTLLNGEFKLASALKLSAEVGGDSNDLGTLLGAGFTYNIIDKDNSNLGFKISIKNNELKNESILGVGFFSKNLLRNTYSNICLDAEFDLKQRKKQIILSFASNIK